MSGRGLVEQPADDTAPGRGLAAIVDELASVGTRTTVLQAFARAVLRRVPAALLEDADPVATAAALADAFAFVDHLRPGEIGVRVVDPGTTFDGRVPAGTVVDVICEDRQFIVASVNEELHRLGHEVVRTHHPVLGCERGPEGRLTAVQAVRGAAHRESFLRVELGERVRPAGRLALIEAVTSVLNDVFAVTGDHDAMRDRIASVGAETRANAGLRYAADEVGEAADLLEWILAGNFVLSGCCDLPAPAPDIGATDGHRPAVGALGILARPDAPRLQPGLEVDSRQLLHFAGTPEVSTVYRQVPMHRIDVARVGPSGSVIGTFRVVGVLSHRANAEPAATTPVVGYKLHRILELEDVLEGGQDEAALVSLFQALPTDELLQADVPTLRRTLVELMAAEHEHDVRALLRVDPGNRLVSALISIPTELYSSALRQRLERFLMVQLDGIRVDADVSLADRPEAIIRLVVHVADSVPERNDGSVPGHPLDALEREVRLLCRTWDQELAVSLGTRVGEERATQLIQAWAAWFTSPYRDATKPYQAVDDLLHLDALLAGDPSGTTDGIRIVLAPDPDGRAQARLKVFSAGAGVELSQFLPIIESLGLWAVEDMPYVLGDERLRVGADRRVHLHDFGVRDPSGAPLDVVGHGPLLAEAAVALWHGRADVDPLNRLVLRATMPWADVAVLRAYLRYRRQVGTAFTNDYVAHVLTENTAAARAIVDLFAARFDPSLDPGPDTIAELRSQIIDSCDAVSLLDHDRIMRGFLSLVDATVRTNRYLGDSAHLALKLQSAGVPDIPRPVPYREIFVHGPAVEGIHLRWGPVARGGIRWSDRPDDYRTEVLDLMRAQVLKNAVIVPTGAKGGFVVKRPRYGADAVDPARAYEIFITALLDVTDNVAGGRVVPVPRRRDSDDPYLVVAADKGTATFSDLANRISVERGFWLGDAFASGGSGGYDHKRIGITARGAWVAVRHHFAALGIDLGPTPRSDQQAPVPDERPDSDPVTVVGIGDMSGDVFGNAMLLSDRIRLVAAFDHRDIFIDPSPAPARSHAERARLFALPHSSWQDYDRALISPGGGVWSRLEKRILLSSEAQALLHMAEEYPTAAELIRAILQAPVALLFAGGVGTFVRASTEADADLDDRRNAEVRVEASSVRARVVGEGANLAFTQRARIEYARRGGHVNTDAIDNSAGVDISDHEVNLKILLALAVESGDARADECGRLLHDACDDVVARVLRNCALQSMALSRAHAASPDTMGATEALLAHLVATGVLDRTVEAMPSTAEMEARMHVGAGLTRPELAVLLAGAKRSLTAALLASPLPDQAAAGDVLASYFPSSVTERFGHLLDRHRLRRELVASVLANDVVDRMGPTFVHRLVVDTRARPASVVAAYVVARRAVDADQWWRRVDESCHATGTEALVHSATVVSDLLDALTRAYLRRDEGDDIAVITARDRPVVSELEAVLAGIGTPYRQRMRARAAEVLTEAAVAPELAGQLACMSELAIGADVADLVRTTGRSVSGIASAMLWVGESLGVDRLVHQVGLAVAEDRWSAAVRRGLVDDLTDLRRLGARRALQEHADLPEPDAIIRFLAERVEQIGEVARLVSEVEGEAQPRLDAVSVATRAVRQAIGGPGEPH